MSPASNLTPNPEGPLPPLPDPLPPFPEPVPPFPAPIQPQPLPFPVPRLPISPIGIRSVRCGCWLVNYTPIGSRITTFDGTIRVECHSAGRTASGDLYQRPIIFVPPTQVTLLPPPNPANGIPILGRDRYRYYLRITQILEHFTFGNSFTLGFEMWRFTAPNSWVSEGAFTAQMTWMMVAAGPLGGFPSPFDYLEGDVRNAANAVVGRLTMGWVSTYFRKATVEIDTVNGSEQPLNNGAGIGWKTVFDTVGWDVTLDVSDTNIAEPSGEGWSDPEMHAAMLAWRDASNLDAKWRYHILAVKFIDSTPRGIMYDISGTDSNNVPREGVGISSHWMIPNGPPWGLVAGLRFGTAPAPYFRTAVHELGHAMGLFHNTVDNGFMNTTDVIAASGTPPNLFPNNIKWNFAEDDLKRLRHYPDIFMRPGGTAFGTASTTTPPISPTDLEVEMAGLELRVTALWGEVPIGAPVRVTLEFVNTSDRVQRVPARLSLKTDFVRGWVVDPSGTMRSFSPVVRCIEDHPMRDLNPGESIVESLTLLRGFAGALFPSPGVHEVTAKVHWDVDGAEAVVRGSTTVMVTATRDEAHAAAAHKLLATPDVHLVLVLGGDHLEAGVEAVQQAVADPVLRPHYAVTEAKRLAQRTGKRLPDFEAAAALVDEAVMTGSEIRRLAKLAKVGGERRAGPQRLVKALKAKAEAVPLTAETKALVDAL